MIKRSYFISLEGFKGDSSGSTFESFTFSCRSFFPKHSEHTVKLVSEFREKCDKRGITGDIQVLAFNRI